MATQHLCHNSRGNLRYTGFQLSRDFFFVHFRSFYMQMYIVILPVGNVSHNYLIIDSFYFRTPHAMTGWRNNFEEKTYAVISDGLGYWQGVTQSKLGVPLLLTKSPECNPNSHSPFPPGDHLLIISGLILEPSVGTLASLHWRGHVRISSSLSYLVMHWWDFIEMRSWVYLASKSWFDSHRVRM